ncbi:MAG: hypothetical protein WKG07_26215 [Hymenobacter sp.]
MLDPNHLGLTIHESSRPPHRTRPRAGLRSQLRRVPASLPSVSGRPRAFTYGSKQVNIVADKTAARLAGRGGLGR